MDLPWKCGDCSHGNDKYQTSCFYCGGTIKIRIAPVRVPNMLQGTPNYDALVIVIDDQERQRANETRSIQEQLDERLGKTKK